MNVILDCRPAAELSNTEIVAHLFRELRARQYRTARQVKDALDRLFPDLPKERAAQCLRELAQVLS